MSADDGAIPIEQAIERFIVTLRAAGGSANRLDLETAWRAFRRFADVPVQTTSDGLLYEFGTFTFDGRERFHVELVRQFEAVDEAGEHDHFVQLRCSLRYYPSPSLGALGKHNEWWFREEDRPLLTFLDAVEERPEWAVLRQQGPTVETSVSQGRV